MRRPATIAVVLLAVAPVAGCGSDAPPATSSAAPAATATATPQVSEAERNAKRDLEAAEGNAAGGTGSTSAPATEPRPGDSSPTAARPSIVQRPIPFGAKRRDEMRAYARRHYGLDSFRLQGPKVIVEHYTAGDTFRSAYDTFARDVPDVELHELPAVCAHFVVDRDGTIYQLVALNNMCRHTVGLNDSAIGIEQVGRSAREIVDRPAQISAVVRLTAWLRCRHAIALRNVIGHNESLSSPYHHENVAALRRQTHADWTRAEMAPVRARIGRYRCPA
jgi:N-acetylmuramoyl-L-alanine amidase